MGNYTEHDILNAVADILRQECKIERDILPDTRLAEDLELDSVGMLTLAVEVENRYQLILEDDVENPPRTVRDVVLLVQKALARITDNLPQQDKNT